ncbi:hypothetical protein [Bacillus sp. SD075]|uniref:hypothetical protein n=1 Tax=Bacillus sp. SD075 TaxID=2781732 RepID=UPI001A96B3E5|nr:hypothetical protein [Bacillus sp. SD075]
MKNNFIIKMDPDAHREYNKLDNSIIEEVDKALESLEQRADKVGKILGKKRQIDLTGSKEKKLRGPGVRIIYTITNEFVEVLRIVVILTVAYKKDDTTVYKNAKQRLSLYRKEEEADNTGQLTSWSSKITKVSEASELGETGTYLYYTKEEFSNNQYELRHEVMDNIFGKGSSMDEALEDLGTKLLDYANEYISNFDEYYKVLETSSHFRYVITIIELAGDELKSHKIVERLCER